MQQYDIGSTRQPGGGGGCGGDGDNLNVHNYYNLSTLP